MSSYPAQSPYDALKNRPNVPEVVLAVAAKFHNRFCVPLLGVRHLSLPDPTADDYKNIGRYTLEQRDLWLRLALRKIGWLNYEGVRHRSSDELPIPLSVLASRENFLAQRWNDKRGAKDPFPWNQAEIDILDEIQKRYSV